jgi:AmiR/NasT family two-component response regulator
MNNQLKKIDKKLNILIAIQNGVIAIDIKNRLEKKGFKATVVIRQQHKSIEESSIDNYHLIILDSNGLNDEFSTAVKLAERKNKSIIYLKTFNNQDDIENSANTFLLMPFDDADLYTAIERAIHKYLMLL